MTETAATNLPDILSALTPSPAAYLRAMRQLEGLTDLNLKPVKVALVSTFTLELLRPYLIVESSRRGLGTELHFAPYNQLEQQLLNQASPLYLFKPDVIVIATRLEDFATRLTNGFLRLSPADIELEVASVIRRVSDLVAGVRQFSTATVLVFNYAAPAILSAGLADATLPSPQLSVIQSINDQLAQVCRKASDVHFFDYARLVSDFGRQRWQDPKLFFMGRIPWRLEAQIETARQLSRYFRALYFPPCKCLVLDLDNTLWGGVLGEEGQGGIALGEDFPGNIYKDFQRYLAGLRDRGILLAIASKNNEAEVRVLFEQHQDCVLRLNDFAAHRINWEEKSASLRAIARDLNIGTDALVFFDDNPVERGLIRAQLPEVTVIEVPQSPLEFTTALEQSGAFDSLTLSHEDRQRHELYSGNQQRQQLQARTISPEDFLRELATTATIGMVGPDTLERIAQLLAKTNQFNLTTRRHSAARIQEMVAGGSIALWLRVADRFGDNGLVGVAIAIPKSADQWLIDTFLLSCRVIGRHVETALVSTLIQLVRARGASEIHGEYVPTAKNTMAADFYSKHGFTQNGNGRWKLGIAPEDMPMPDHIAIRIAENSPETTPGKNANREHFHEQTKSNS